jgi:acyl-CoA dehydrogenase
MDFLLSDSQRQLRDRTRALVEEHILPHCAQLDETNAVDWKVAALLARERIIGIVIPEEYGGIGAGVEALPISLVREQLARGSANVDVLFAMQGLGSYPIIIAGSEEQKRRYLPPIARAEKLAAYAVTEPRAGSDVGALETTAVRHGDKYVINGSKVFISNAGVASSYVLFAKTDPGAGAKGISAFVIDSDTPGFEVVRQLDLMAPHTIGELALRDCAVPAENLLGELNQGFKIAMATFDVYRASVGAAAVGISQGAFEEAVQYSRARVQFGAPIVDHQVTRFKIADMATQIDAARLMVYRAAKLKDLGAPRVTKEASMAKLFATEVAGRVVDEALQIHGGNGVRRGFRIERLYRQARALRIYEGASEIQRMIIAGNVLREMPAASGQAGGQR